MKRPVDSLKYSVVGEEISLEAVVVVALYNSLMLVDSTLVEWAWLLS